MTYKAVDVMGFAGGFTLGMVQAGFELAGKCEPPGEFGVANCEANRHLLGHLWKTQCCDPVNWEPLPNIHVVFGNPPCSGFSVMSTKSFRGANSRINEYMWHFIRYAAKMRPEIVVFESVQPACRREDGRNLMRQLRTELEELTGYQYGLWHVLHNAYSVGGPAQRRRYFWLASRIPFGVEKPTLQYMPVLNDIIDDLAPLPLTWQSQPYQASPTPYAKQFRSPSGLVDGMITCRETPLMRRMQDLMRGVRWEPGMHLAQVVKQHYDTYGRLPPSFDEFAEKIIKNNFNMGFTTPIRWVGTNHARVITGASLYTVLHPTLNRTLTHREAARILGFPDDWRIYPLRTVNNVVTTWGKGITVHCGKWIGSWIHRALDGQPGSWTGDDAGNREKVIDITNSWKTFVVQSIRKPSQHIRMEHMMDESTETIEATEVVEPIEAVETTEVAEVVAAVEAEATTTSRRGRPRPNDVIERDNAMLEQLTGPMSRQELAEKTGIKPSHVYLSLLRLRNDGKVRLERTGTNHIWHRNVSATVADDAIEAGETVEATEVTEAGEVTEVTEVTEAVETLETILDEAIAPVE